MIETMRAVVQNILNHWDLTDYCAGTVEALEPLQVRLNDRLLLEAANLIAACEMDNLQLGDKLVLLKVLRGQKYIVLSKAVEI